MENKSLHQRLVKIGLSISCCLIALPESLSAGFSAAETNTLASKRNEASNSIILAPANRARLVALNGEEDASQKTIFVNFNNISIIEYLRFVSRNTNKNFIFDENDLQFNITLISEEPTTIENIMTALMQELRIHELTVLEQGNNIIIHKNPKVNAISQVVSNEIPPQTLSEIVTQVFRLNSADVDKIASVIKPLTSEYALVESIKETNHLIITDLSTNVAQIANLIKSLDSPASGLVIGQYVVRTSSTGQLIPMAEKVLAPIAQDQTFIMVPWGNTNSIFIVSSPFLVERALSILQYLDQNRRATQIIDLNQWKYEEPTQEELPPSGLFINEVPYEKTPEQIEIEEQRLRDAAKESKERAKERVRQPGWQRAPNGQLRFYSDVEESPVETERSDAPPRGAWKLDSAGKWHFAPSNTPDATPGGLGEPIVPGQTLEKGQWQEFEPSWREQQRPKGRWRQDPDGLWYYELERGETPIAERLTRRAPLGVDVPLGRHEKSSFSIYKVQYRRGDAIQAALQAIAQSLQMAPTYSETLIGTLTSVQWLETSNSLIFTGFREDLLKMRQLMMDIDVPLRQVFVEMLILETSLRDSLEYGVTWGSRFGGGNTAGQTGFVPAGGSPLGTALDTTGQAVGGLQPNNLVTSGFSLGVIGQSIIETTTGIEFNSIGALFQAVRNRDSINIVLNPKILTEDSVPAEVFVGENIAFKTQSIASGDFNQTITNNFEYRDVGTRLRVTPTLGNNDMVTLEISQEISAISPVQFADPANLNNFPGPNTTKSTTTTRVHLPDGYFLIISGMMRDEAQTTAIQVPCLGAIPVLGPFFGKDKVYANRKRNQMIFIRPKIIQTEEEVQNITKHNQDIWKNKHDFKQDWIYESEKALDFLNLQNSCQEEFDPEFLPYNQ